MHFINNRLPHSSMQSASDLIPDQPSHSHSQSKNSETKPGFSQEPDQQLPSQTTAERNPLQYANHLSAEFVAFISRVLIEREFFQNTHIPPELLLYLANDLIKTLYLESKEVAVNMPTELFCSWKQWSGRTLSYEEQVYCDAPKRIDVMGEILNGVKYSSMILMGQTCYSSVTSMVQNRLWSHIPAICAYTGTMLFGYRGVSYAVSELLAYTALSQKQKELLEPWLNMVGRLALGFTPKVNGTEEGLHYHYPSRDGFSKTFSHDQAVTLQGNHLLFEKAGFLTTPEGTFEGEYIADFKLKQIYELNEEQVRIQVINKNGQEVPIEFRKLDGLYGPMITVRCDDKELETHWEKYFRPREIPASPKEIKVESSKTDKFDDRFALASIPTAHVARISMLQTETLHHLSPAPSPIPLTKPSRFRNENTILIKEVLSLPSKTPDDVIYAHLIGSYCPDLKKARIETKLEGSYANETFSYLLDTQRAYLNALQQHPDFSTSCKEETCRAIFGSFGFDTATMTDTSLIGMAIEKMEFALEILDTQNDTISQNRMIRDKFKQLNEGETFFFPISWIAPEWGHAMVLEVEKQSLENVTIRLFNVGDGIRYHTSRYVEKEPMVIPFTEIVNIPTERLTGGPFMSFLARIGNQEPPTGPAWNAVQFYETALAGLSGEISHREVSAELLTPPQYIGNCAMASAIAILDKTYISGRLADRMRFLTLMRATIAYYEKNQVEFLSGTHREARRRLLLKGVKATLETAERAIESGGLIGDEVQEALQRLRTIQKEVESISKSDVGTLSQHVVHFNGSRQWVSKILNLSYAKTFAPQTKKSLPDPVLTPRVLASIPVDIFQGGIAALTLNLSAALQNLDHPAITFSEKRWIVMKILLQIPAKANSFTNLPITEFSSLFSSVIRLQRELIQSSLIDLKTTLPALLTPEAMIALIKVHTIIDIAMQEEARLSGIILPHQRFPFIDVMLGISPITEAPPPLAPKGPWIYEISSLRKYWKNVQKQQDFYSPFYISQHPIGAPRDQTERHIPSTRGLKEFIIAELGNYWDESIEYNDIAFIIEMIQKSPNIIKKIFPELNNHSQNDQAVQILAGVDTKGIFYRHRLPSIDAAFQSSLQFNLIQTTDIDKFPLNDKAPLIELLATKVNSGSGHFWTMSYTIDGARIQGNFHTPNKPAGWPQQLAVASLSDNQLEQILRSNQKDGAISALRSLSTNDVAITTPLTIDALFSVGIQEGRDLLDLRSTAELQTYDAATKFRSHLLQLLDSDHIAILNTFIEDFDAIREGLKTIPNLPEILGKLCSMGRDVGLMTESPATAGYFASLSRILTQFLIEAGRQEEIRVEIASLMDASSAFIQLITDTNPITEKDRLRTLHYHRAKSFSAHQKLTAEEAGELVASFNYLQIYGLPEETQHHPAMGIDDVKTMVFTTHAKAIKDYLANTNNCNIMLRAVAQAIDPSSKAISWAPFNTYPRYISDDHTMLFNASTYIVTRMSEGQSATPPQLLQDPIFQSIMKNVLPSLDQTGLNSFSHIDRDGIHYRFFVINGNPIVQKMFGTRWYQAENPEGLIDLPITMSKSTRSAEAGLLWIPVEDDQMLFNRSGKESEPLYYTGPNEGLFLELEKSASDVVAAHLLTSKLTRTELLLIDTKNTDMEKFIERIESCDYTFSFSNNKGEIVKIVMPRLGLVFAQDPKEPTVIRHLSASGLDGYGLVTGKQLEPLLGDFSRYLPLQKIGKNGQEERAVIIPYYHIEPINNGDRLTTPTSLAVLATSWKETVPYFFYQLRQDTLYPVVSNTRDAIRANAHIAAIFLSEMRYEYAAKYLKTVDLLLKSTIETFGIEVTDAIKTIANFESVNNDITPDAVAIRLHANAMLARISTLGQTTKYSHHPADEDLRRYTLHLNRVNAAVRLSNEETRILYSDEEAVTAPMRSTKGPAAGNLDFSSWNIDDPQLKIDFQDDLVVFPATPFKEPTSTAAMIVSINPVFIQAFPEEILSLYALLKDHTAVSSSKMRNLARQFSLDNTLSSQELQGSLSTLIELRYRFLIERLKAAKKNSDELSPEELARTLSPKQLLALQLEANFLSVLATASRGTGLSFDEVESKMKMHADLAGAYRILPTFKAEVNNYDSLVHSVVKEALKETLALWQEWITPQALPISLKIPKATGGILSPIGPHRPENIDVTIPSPDPLIDYTTNSTDFFRRNYEGHALNLSLKASVLDSKALNDILNIRLSPDTKTSSPFSVKASDPGIAKIFDMYHKDFNKFLDSAIPSMECSLVNKIHLQLLIEKIQTTLKSISGDLTNIESQLLALLNKRAEETTLRGHIETRILRGSQKELSFNDAKASLGKGWDVYHIHQLNPSLSTAEIGNILLLTMNALFTKREVQRNKRLLDAATTLSNTNTESHLWQSVAQNFVTVGREQLEYDPYDEPLLLIGETEFDISLWKEQIPAIRNLAPKDQVASLVELAMGLGKTEVISPTVLTLLADGKTLPILVMPDSLLPSMAVRLQENIGKIYNGEIRVIPIDRIERSAEKIDRLTNEFQVMITQKVSLLWSSTDIQTLINSFLEDMEMLKTKGNKDDNYKKIKSWQRLFNLLRSSAKIIGDEIHAILDILTSYNFTIGSPKSVSIDEMSAVADFFSVVATHPTAQQIRLPLKGNKGTIPLTDEHFTNIVVPEIIDTLIKRGITNDARSRELVSGLSKVISMC